jgi:hypothetical protein
MSYEPTGWSTSNFGIYDDTGVSRYQPAHTGNYACGLKTNFILGTFTFPGILRSTFPFTQKPDAMEGYFKGNLSTDDTTVILIEFSKDTNVIADGTLYITQSQNSYVKFSVPIDFFGLGAPDSCSITIIGGGFEIDDTLTSIAVDDLIFTYPVNIDNITFKLSDHLKLYPNPASDILHIACNEPYSTIRIYNTTGQMVANYSNETSISLTEFENGIYYLQLLDENGQVVARKSFMRN